MEATRTPRAARASAAASDWRGEAGSVLSASVASRPLANPARPDVTIKGRCEPSRALPSVSIAPVLLGVLGEFGEIVVECGVNDRIRRRRGAL